MKIRNVLKIIYFALILSLFASCTEDIFSDRTSQVEEGLAANVQLNFRTKPKEIMTRSEQSEYYESRVDNIYVFIFDGAGGIKDRVFCEQGTGLSHASGSMSSGTLTFETSSLNNATIVGIANLTTATTATAYNVTETDMDNIGNLEELRNFIMKMKNNTIYRGALFMMTGYVQDNDGNTVIAIPGTEGGGTSTLTGTLVLERTDAKIAFEVRAEAQPDWRDFHFQPKEWRIKRVPAQSLLLESANDADGTECTYFTSNSYSFESIAYDEDNIMIGGDFVFYMPENKKTPVNPVSEYAMREEWQGQYANGDKVFVNANANSTYVEMTGTLSYIDGSGQLFNADLTMTVHLGYAVKKGSGDVPDVNDYNTLRNGDYTYYVTIKGINDIEVEVKLQEDRRPGYEGDITIGSIESIFEFDAHYDRRLISFNKADLDGDLMWSLNTPFSRGTHVVSGKDDVVPESLRDYRWVKFAVNRDYGVNDNVYVKYPGDQNYNDPYPMAGAPNDEVSPYYKNTYPEARLLDVNQLIIRFKEEVEKDKAGNGTGFFDANGDVAITVFVDENLYFNHPITGESGENNRSLWRLTTNTEDRQLHIIVSDASFSPDGNSSIVTSKFSFKQRPIRTIYDANNPDLTTAWGLESIMETGRLSVGNVSNGTDSRNGRLNTLRCLLGNDFDTAPYQLKWTDVIGVGDSYEMVGEQSALRACLMRNRDLDGDNIVDANEIRWYLAAIDQLTDIYIGEYALDQRSYLYPVDPSARENKVRWHYTSSTGSGNESWIIWAEEGASRGLSGGSKDDYNNTNTKFAYRCIRNLGLSLSNPNEVPVGLIQVFENTPSEGYYTIDMSYMNPKSRRTNKEVAQLPTHNEHSSDNRPYTKFVVHPNSTSTFHSWQYYQTYSGYPDGYRIPNQRELLIMTTRMPSDAWPLIGRNYYCQTAFSMNGKYPYNDQREGFYWDSNSGNFILQNYITDRGYVRPIADTD